MSQSKNARVSWKGSDLEFRGTLGSGYELDLGPASETAASPMELMLVGVAGCTAIDVVNVLRKMRQPISGLEVEISGERAANHPRVYTAVEIVYVVRGEGVTPESVERAIRLSKDTYCSASRMFAEAGVAITTGYRLESA